jgi:hypothetical protein
MAGFRTFTRALRTAICALALAACHPVAGDSAGRPTPPADAPSDGAASGAPADVSSAPSSNVSAD